MDLLLSIMDMEYGKKKKKLKGLSITVCLLVDYFFGLACLTKVSIGAPLEFELRLTLKQLFPSCMIIPFHV